MPSNPIHVLTVARLVALKGLRHGLEAFAQAVRYRPNIQLHYTLVGSGPMKEELARAVSQLGIRNQVTFFGAATSEQVQSLMQQSDIFMLPSLEEAAGLVNIEAAATGIPVIATNVGGVPEVVRDNVTGFLVPTADSDALADRLLRLIDDPTLRQRMGLAGREHVESTFDNARLNRRLVKIYEHLLEGRSFAAFEDPMPQLSRSS